MSNFTKLKFIALDISDKNYLLWSLMLRSEAMKHIRLKHWCIDENEHIRTINKKYLKAYNKLLVNETTFIHKQHYESVTTLYSIKVNKITIKDKHFLSEICRTNKLYIQDNKTTLLQENTEESEFLESRQSSFYI